MPETGRSMSTGTGQTEFRMSPDRSFLPIRGLRVLVVEKRIAYSHPDWGAFTVVEYSPGHTPSVCGYWGDPTAGLEQGYGDHLKNIPDPRIPPPAISPAREKHRNPHP